MVMLSGCLNSNSRQAALPPNQALELVQIPAINNLVEENTIPEPETTVNEEIAELEQLGSWEQGAAASEEIAGAKISYDFPITINKQVEFYLDFFQNRQRATFTKWLERSTRYLPMIQARLQEAGLPLDLAYLPMIESGFSLTAYSRARAAGPWQFISSTARHYGLKINNYEDERRDPIKSTDAAIAFLSDLHGRFNDWHLAVAAYNAGGGKISNGLRRHQVDNFWDLAQQRYLHSETKLYVPKLIAAIIIAKDPDTYGFNDINYQKPLEYEVVNVPRWTSLRAVVAAKGGDFEELRELNRQLRKTITPPDKASYPLKVPKGHKEIVARNIKKVYPVVGTNYKTHVVRTNDTLTAVCNTYNISKLTLLKTNNLESAKLRRGQRLRIPYQTTEYVLWDKESSPPVALADADLILHKIKTGETVSLIARRYGVPQHMIAIWNNLDDLGRIRAGQQLAIYLDDASQAEREQERLARLAQSSTPPPTSSANPDGKVIYYQVKQGDSLWTIARRFNLEMDQIRRWNTLKNDTIHPGTKLLIRTASL